MTIKFLFCKNLTTPGLSECEVDRLREQWRERLKVKHDNDHKVWQKTEPGKREEFAKLRVIQWALDTITKIVNAKPQPILKPSAENFRLEKELIKIVTGEMGKNAETRRVRKALEDSLTKKHNADTDYFFSTTETPERRDQGPVEKMGGGQEEEGRGGEEEEAQERGKLVELDRRRQILFSVYPFHSYLRAQVKTMCQRLATRSRAEEWYRSGDFGGELPYYCYVWCAFWGVWSVSGVSGVVSATFLLPCLGWKSMYRI